MEIKIGVRHIAREIVVETTESKDVITEKVAKAIEDGSLLHTPTVRAKKLAAEGRTEDYVQALETLYGIQVEDS